MDGCVNIANNHSASDKNQVNFGLVTHEFCRRVCAGQATHWSLPCISGLYILFSLPTTTVFQRCLYVCLSARYLKADAARITKLDIQLFHDEFCKPFYFSIKRSQVKVKRLCRL